MVPPDVTPPAPPAPEPGRHSVGSGTRAGARRAGARRAGRLTTVLGVVLLATGFGLGGWLLWQFYGTDYVAGREQTQLRDEVRKVWDAAPAQAVEVDAALPSGVEALVRIPRWGTEWEKPLLVGFDTATLKRSLGRLPEGARPGEVGNLVIAGHRVTHGSPFREMLGLRAGDTVEVETADAVHVYELRGEVVEVDFTTEWPLFAVPEPGGDTQEPTEALVTLITCAELFQTDARSVITGVLVASAPK